MIITDAAERLRHILHGDVEADADIPDLPTLLDAALAAAYENGYQAAKIQREADEADERRAEREWWQGECSCHAIILDAERDR